MAWHTRFVRVRAVWCSQRAEGFRSFATAPCAAPAYRCRGSTAKLTPLDVYSPCFAQALAAEVFFSGNLLAFFRAGAACRAFYGSLCIRGARVRINGGRGAVPQRKIAARVQRAALRWLLRCHYEGLRRARTRRACGHARRASHRAHVWCAGRRPIWAGALVLGSLCLRPLARLRFGRRRLDLASHLRRAAFRCHGLVFHNLGGVEAARQGEVRARGAASRGSSRAGWIFAPRCLHGVGAVVHGCATAWSGARAPRPSRVLLCFQLADTCDWCLRRSPRLFLPRCT